MSTTNELPVKVSQRQSGVEQWYEGTVSISGLQPTKLARKSDGSTRFTTRSSLTNAARTLAKTLGYNGVAVEEPRKVAAKASATTVKPKTVSKKTTTTTTTQ